MRAIQKTKTENNKALYPGVHRSKLSTFGGFRYMYICICIISPVSAQAHSPKNSSGGLFWVTMRLDKKFTTLWVKKITGTQLFFENEWSIIS